MEYQKLTFWVSEKALPYIIAQFEEGYVEVAPAEGDGTVKIALVVDNVAACKLVIAGQQSVRAY